MARPLWARRSAFINCWSTVLKFDLLTLAKSINYIGRRLMKHLFNRAIA